MIEAVINTWLSQIEKDLVVNYDKLGLRASGNWADSLERFQNLTEGRLKFGIKGNDYTEQLENGRRPNRNQSPEKLKAWVGWAGSTFLKDWVDSKNIKASPYAIAWKIAREGWTVPNKNNAGGLVSDVVTKDKIIDLSRDISQAIILDFKNSVLKNIK